MDGMTRCPHCETRFRIGVTQLEAHQGMVRCGKCMQVFDAWPDFIPDQPSPQLELVIPAVLESAQNELSDIAAPLQVNPQEHNDTAIAEQAVAHEHSAEHTEVLHDDVLDFVTSPQVAIDPTVPNAVYAENDDTLDEHAQAVTDELTHTTPPRRAWLWAMVAISLSVLLIAQLAYYFRADIAARQPGLKNVLQQYCELLACKVGLPQNYTLMSIESSALEADPNSSSHITLSALLRNRATYPLAFPDLELTLNDRQDKPVARRSLKPADYLPSGESVAAGLLGNHELNIKVFLDTTDLYPNGYRLMLTYPTVN